LWLVIVFCLELVSNFKFSNEKFIHPCICRTFTYCYNLHKSLAIKLKINKLAENYSISVKRVKWLVRVFSVVRPNKVESLYLLKFGLQIMRCCIRLEIVCKMSPFASCNLLMSSVKKTHLIYFQLEVIYSRPRGRSNFWKSTTIVSNSVTVPFLKLPIIIFVQNIW